MNKVPKFFPTIMLGLSGISGHACYNNEKTNEKKEDLLKLIFSDEQQKDEYFKQLRYHDFFNDEVICHYITPLFFIGLSGALLLPKSMLAFMFSELGLRLGLTYYNKFGKEFNYNIQELQNSYFYKALNLNEMIIFASCPTVIMKLLITRKF